MFERWVAVDWSGSGTDSKRASGLAVALWSAERSELEFAHPQPRSRQEMTGWLAGKLSPTEPPTLIGLDFGFGYPAPAASVVFGAKGWRDLTFRIAELLERHGTAREVAGFLNSVPSFNGHGPFRLENRNDHHFYVEHGVPYLRLTEQFAPQAISQWYLGPGAALGFSTITGLACVGRLIKLQENGATDFAVFPFESPTQARHVVAEIYPALYPSAGTKELRGHRHDAEKSVRWLHQHYRHKDALRLPSIPGFEADVIRHQACEEGWILGIGEPSYKPSRR